MSKGSSKSGGGKSTGNKSASKSKSTVKSKSTKVKSKGGQGKIVNPSKPVFDNHPGAKDTQSIQNPTLNENGTTKRGHGLKHYTGEQLSKMGADKHLSKLYKSKNK